MNLFKPTESAEGGGIISMLLRGEGELQEGKPK